MFAQDERPAGEWLPGAKGQARDTGQNRVIDEAGFNEFTPEILNSSQIAEIDNIVEEAFDKQPFMSDTDIKKNISKSIPANSLAKAFRFLKETYDLPGNSWRDLTNAQKRNVRGRVVNGLFREAENRLGKQAAPSRRSDFSLEEGIEDYILDAFNPLERANSNYIKQVSDHLKKAWPGITIASTPSELKAAASELDIPVSMIKGAWVSSDNKVLINPDMATYDTPIHEFAHIWARQLQRQNPELWKRGVELLKGSKYMKKVDSIPAYRNLRKTGQLSRFYEEVMANAIGKRGYQIYGSQRAAGKWDNWMKKFGDWIKNKLGIKADKPYDQLTLNDWIDVGVHGVFTGGTPVTQNTLDASIEAKTAMEMELERDLAAKAGARKTSKWYNKPFEWLMTPAADDYHGLVERFKNKVGEDSDFAKKFDSLTDKYVNNYQQYEKDATKIRDGFNKSGAELAKKLGLKVSRVGKALGDKASGSLDGYFAKDSGIKYKGAPLTINEALMIAMNPTEFPSGIVDKINNNLNPDILEFAKKQPFKIKPGDTIQSAMIDYINKDVFKDSMKDFLDYKDKNFNKEALKDITSQMDDRYGSALENSLDRMAGASGRPTDPISQKWNDWLNNSVGAIMFLNVRSAALQGLSIWNYMSPGNLIGFNRDLGSIISNPSSAQRKLFNELWNDSSLKERRARAGFDVNASEILDAAKKGDLGRFTKKMLNRGFFLTSAMDSFAIAAGGTAFVRQEMKAGKSKAEALKAWREKTQEAQQSARPDRVSQHQKASVSKFILAFANTPAQYFRLSQKAYRAIKKHGITSKEGMAAARKIAYYMAIQNAIFTMAQSASSALITGWDGDDEEKKEAENQLNSMADTWLRGMGLYGAVLAAAKSAALNSYRESKKSNPDYSKSIVKGALQISPPLNRKINQVQGIGRAYTYKQEREKTGIRSPHAVAIGKGGEALLNLPTDWIQKKLAATQALYEGDATLEEFLWMLGGYSEYSVLGKKDKGGIDLDLDLEDLDLDLDLDI